MKKIILGMLLTIVLTIASGILQGSLCNRWGASELQRQAGAKLESFPEKVAVWEMKKADKLDKTAIDQLEPYGYIQRVYVNRNNGAVVNVTVLLGASGPMSVHTPEVCFAGRDHEQLGERQKIDIPGKEGKDSLWRTAFRLNGVDAQLQNTYYAWSSSGQHWVAVENPRFSFATEPLLYKIQLANMVSAESSKKTVSTDDPAIQFLSVFLPALRNHLDKPSLK
jgi:hypothetical protein